MKTFLVALLTCVIAYGCATTYNQIAHDYILEQLTDLLGDELTDEQIESLTVALVTAGAESIEHYCKTECGEDIAGLCLLCSDQAVSDIVPQLSQIGNVSPEAEINFVTGSGGL